ncbi:uncharacterized protein NECHADRAFT_100746 [Fusarium vanettenii 77-13-4]|uniref:BTB domain-containing protein n=1 Tax=Fusarium vanettenii (strain ATCC MYA-4622 / CBS 123669 / FGSC 9596 / NRRL 45880 / 77-13-4) TaxID=660122 RepID=C7ZHM4_FUSV7|nr:uncharacterized protein NECHADRAFT_100746 [Fusarium vanettenii 77-13-4]EEU36439.1 hypothetical protein NECHADRAFT_100746 [Fusarium vanettenii 77-13-4]
MSEDSPSSSPTAHYAVYKSVESDGTGISDLIGAFGSRLRPQAGFMNANERLVGCGRQSSPGDLEGPMAQASLVFIHRSLPNISPRSRTHPSSATTHPYSTAMTSNGSEESRSRSNMSPDMDLEKDTRPEHSPYASEPCAVLFRDRKTLYIPRESLNQVEQISRYLVRGGPKLKAHFTDITSATGHVLLHFLVCGAYQSLRPEGDSLEKRQASEFKTALDVYVAADSLQLPRLRDLARREMARVGDTLSLPSIMSAFEDSDMSSNIPLGVTVYLESRILSFAEEATPAVVESMLPELEGPNTLSRILLRSIVRLKSSKLSKQQQELHGKKGEVCFGTPKNVLEGKMRRRMSTTEQAMKEAEAKAETLSKEAEVLPLAEKASSEKPEAFPAEEEPAKCAPAEEGDREMQSLLTKEEISALHCRHSKRGGRPEAFPGEEALAKCAPAKKADCEVQSLLTKEEISALNNFKQSKRGGRRLKGDRAHLEFLIERALVDADLKPLKATDVAPNEEATTVSSAVTPALDAQERQTLNLPGSLNTERDHSETASFDRPGSRSSGTWSFAGTPASHSSQISPKVEVSKDHAGGREDDVLDWDAIFKAVRKKNQGRPS